MKWIQSLKNLLGMNLIEGEDFYRDDRRQKVFTEEYHLKRGYCCSNGCLNCPYDYKNVPEPRRTELLNERKQRKQENGD